jgi:DNA-binding NarL/FixJ family response regulator
LSQKMANLVVLIIDDHPVVISGCRTILSRDTGIKVIAAHDHKSGMHAFTAHRPDVTIVDINLPDLSGFEVLRQIRKRSPDAAVIMLSMNDEPTFVVRSVELGAKGFLSKGDDPKLLLNAVRQVAKGGTFIAPELAKIVAFSNSAARSNPTSELGPRELETLRLLARGQRIGEVADALGVSYKTVANTASLLKKKLGARSNPELIRIAMDMGMG